MNGIKMKNRESTTRKPAKVKQEKPPRVWINPNSSFKGPRSNHSQLSPPSAARLLELADIALRSAQASPPLAKKKKAAA